MATQLVILAIRTESKALIIKKVLEENSIEVFLEKVQGEAAYPNACYIRIKEERLSDALSIIEANNLFEGKDKSSIVPDDGRRRILVPVDFSEHSRNACTVAFSIAKQMNAKVKILHVYNNIYYPLSFPFADKTKDANDMGHLDKVRKQMLDLCFEIDQRIQAGKLPSINYSYSIREGIPEEEIENFVTEYNPFLLVMGTRGKDDNATKVVGDVTADVVEMTNVPVLAVPGHIDINENTTVNHIMFLTNLSERDITSFDTLVNLLQPYENVKITLMHINVINKKGEKWGKDDLAKMKAHFLERYPQLNINYELLDSHDMLTSVREFIEAEHVSVVALNTRRRSLLGRIFMPSFSRKVLEASDMVSLLVLRG